MNNEAIALDECGLEVRDDGAFETAGTVTKIMDGVMNVCTARGTFRARRAFSCLVVPEESDVVLLVNSGTGLYVLAVLERLGDGNARISADGDLSIELKSGSFTVAATEGVNVVSRQTVSVTADRVEASAREGSFLLDSISVFASVFDSVVERVSQQFKRLYRRVDDLEHVRAGQIDYTCEGNLRLHGQNAVITAREIVKADGKQVHIG